MWSVWRKKLFQFNFIAAINLIKWNVFFVRVGVYGRQKNYSFLQNDKILNNDFIGLYLLSYSKTMIYVFDKFKLMINWTLNIQLSSSDWVGERRGAPEKHFCCAIFFSPRFHIGRRRKSAAGIRYLSIIFHQCLL